MGDSIEGQTGDGGRNTVIGKGNRQKEIHTSNDYIQRDQSTIQGGQVHVEVGGMDSADQRQARIESQLAAMAGDVQRLSNDVQRLSRALIGDTQYGSTGIVHQVQEMDRWRAISAWALVLLVVVNVVQAWWYYMLYTGLSQKLLDLSRDLIDLSQKIAR